eukprot:1199827-Prymnesium_polylepis.1
MPRVRTRMIGCRVVYAAGHRATAVPFGPCAHSSLSDSSRRRREPTRSRPASDTHSTRQLRVGRALTAPPPPQQLWLPLEYSREGLRPK